MTLKRQTFKWEVENYKEFLELLNGIYLEKNTSDRVV